MSNIEEKTKIFQKFDNALSAIFGYVLDAEVKPIDRSAMDLRKEVNRHRREERLAKKRLKNYVMTLYSTDL